MPAYGPTSYAGGPYAGLNAGNSPASQLNGGRYPFTLVEIGFGSRPLTDPVTWTDVSLYAMVMRPRRGRQHELNKFEAGTATIVLNNRDGRFSTFNGSSPYAGQLVPGVPVRIRAIWNGVTYPVFRGVVESWPTRWSAAADSEVTLNCVDITKILNSKKAANFNTYSTTVLADSPRNYYQLNDAAGSLTAVDSAGTSPGVVTINTSTDPGAYPPQFGAQTALVASNGSGFDSGSVLGMISVGGVPQTGNCASVEFWVKVRQTGGLMTLFSGNTATRSCFVRINDGSVAGTVQGALTLQLDTGINIFDLYGFRVITDGNWHQIVAVSNTATTTLSLYVDGVLDASVTSVNITNTFPLGGALGGTSYIYTQGGTPTVNAFFDELSLYTAALTATQIQSHYNAARFPLAGQTSGQRINAFLTAVGVPSTLAAVDTGISTLQAATNTAITSSALINMQAVADTEGGQLFVDAAGKVTFYDRFHTSRSPNGAPGVILGDSGTIGPGGESPYLIDAADLQRDDVDIWNVAVVTPTGQGPQTYSDQASITKYSERTLTMASLTASNVEAAGQAQWAVNKYKETLDRLRTVVFTPMSDPDVLFPAALGFDLLIRAEVRRRPKDGAASTFDQQSLIEGIEHEISPGQWRTTWRLSPTDATPLMWIIEDPVAGKIVENPLVGIGW